MLHGAAVISSWCSLSEQLLSFSIKSEITGVPRREPHVTRNTYIHASTGTAGRTAVLYTAGQTTRA